MELVETWFCVEQNIGSAPKGSTSEAVRTHIGPGRTGLLGRRTSISAMLLQALRRKRTTTTVTYLSDLFRCDIPECSTLRVLSVTNRYVTLR